MKYIRTKNGIYDTTTMSVSKLFDNGTFVKNLSYSKQIDNFTFLHICENEIISKADTIPELCDEFIWKWNKSEFPYSTARQHCRFSGWGDLKRTIREEENYGKYLKQDYVVYGAIWTDKGLIYVAKMNEKGELELL